MNLKKKQGGIFLNEDTDKILDIIYLKMNNKEIQHTV